MVAVVTARPVSWFGDRAVSVSLTGPDDREHVAAVLTDAFPHLLVRRGMASVLVEAPEPDPRLRGAVQTALSQRGESTPGTAPLPARVVTIEVRYDGADLADVAAGLGCSPAAVVQAHQAQAWRVAMMGFAPGFGYLVPQGEPALGWEQIPRLSRPRDRVAAGSVALAAGMSAVYPQPMPGGWALIGRTSVRLFDPADEGAPALLAPGDLVAFRRFGG